MLSIIFILCEGVPSILFRMVCVDKYCLLPKYHLLFPAFDLRQFLMKQTQSLTRW